MSKPHDKAAPPQTKMALVPKKTRTRHHVTPTNLRKLCDRIGVPAMAQRLGYTDTAIYKMLTADSCVKVVEIAATSMLDDRDKDKRHLYMVKVPAEYREPVEKTLQAFGCQFRHFID